ncbi:MAG: PAS domain S-box protein, partial [Verrucomicrobiae bacterium]|nr:PAS domain S-box protein [Verrucomicrobiae bacterium]
MPSPTPSSPAERERIAVLREYQILGTAPEDAFTDLARLAAQLCDTPIALIGFVDESRVWVKAQVGLNCREIPREQAICERVIRAGRPYTVTDLSEDAGFRNHPLVAGETGLRFFAGIPLIGRRNMIVGTLCVMAPGRRELDPAQYNALEVLGRQVVTQLDLRRNLRQMKDLVHEHEQAEADLAEAERQFRGIFENSTEGIFQTTPEGTYRIANPRLAQIYGYATKEEMIKAIRRIGHQLYVKPGRRQEFESLLRDNHEVVGFESEVYRRDGRRIWISENARSVHDGNGHLLYYEGTVVDITARKRAEQRLRDSELLYHSLVESLSHNIFRKDLEGRFTFVNSTFAQTVGRPVEEIIGRTDPDLFPEALAVAYQADDRQVIRTGLPMEKVERHRRADGTFLYVHVLKSPLQDNQGHVVGIQGIFWDETERHEMEEKLAYERDLLRALLDTMPDAIYFKDRESRFLRCSQEMARRVGVASPEDLRGKTDFDLFSGDHAQQAFDDEQEIIRTGTPLLGKPEHETWRDGRESWVLSSKMPFRDQDGHIIGTL